MWGKFINFPARHFILGGVCVSGTKFAQQRYLDNQCCAAEVALSSPKTVLITGGSRGIGRACALQCAREGWQVAVTFAKDEGAADEVKRLVEREGVRAVIVQGDVSEERDVKRMFDVAEQALGPIDAVVNNAGAGAKTMRLAEMPVERLKRTFDVNILGTFLVARESARRLSTKSGGKGGVLVNVSSAAARLGSPNEFVDYASSKGACDTLTIGLAKELALDGVRVNAVRPGLIKTDFHTSVGDASRAERVAAQMPMGRAGSAEEVAEAIVWLLSDKSSYVTGTLLDVAGGR